MLKYALAASALAALVATPSFAETITATFTQPDGGVTTGLYDNIVQITVSGTGQSAATNYNDAFYIFADAAGNPIGPSRDPSYYQMTFGVTTLVGYNPSQDIVNYLVGPVPAYNPSHSYTFDINTGVSTPTQLHFGVSDGIFSDNSGAYTITVTAVPEASTWAMVVAGFAGLGFAAARRRSASRQLAELS